MKGHQGVADILRRSREVLLSPVVAAELLYGFRRGSRYERNYRDFQAFLENPHVRVPPITMITADRFARIAIALRSKGKPIPTNDIWIASHALESGADLISFDRHFGLVDGLVWIEPQA